jgi:hypothetical protein
VKAIQNVMTQNQVVLAGNLAGGSVQRGGGLVTSVEFSNCSVGDAVPGLFGRLAPTPTAVFTLT